MFQVDPRTRNSLYGLIGVILAAGWVAYGTLNGGQVFLTIMLVLTILLGGVATFLFRVRGDSTARRSRDRHRVAGQDRTGGE